MSRGFFRGVNPVNTKSSRKIAESILSKFVFLIDVFQSAVSIRSPRLGLTREAVHVPVLSADVNVPCNGVSADAADVTRVCRPRKN